MNCAIYRDPAPWRGIKACLFQYYVPLGFTAIVSLSRTVSLRIVERSAFQVFERLNRLDYSYA